MRFGTNCPSEALGLRSSRVRQLAAAFLPRTYSREFQAAPLLNPAGKRRIDPPPASWLVTKRQQAAGLFSFILCGNLADETTCHTRFYCTVGRQGISRGKESHDHPTGTQSGTGSATRCEGSCPGHATQKAAARILEEAMLPVYGSPSLSVGDFHAMLASMAEGSERLPNLATEI